MSRRKSGLSAKHLEALKHLPEVLEALEALQVEHGKVRALMGASSIPNIRMVVDPMMPPGTARLGPGADGRSVTITNIGGSAPILLDTPERREYEAAKRSGQNIQAAADPFANATPEQRARMEEQRAYLASQGRGRASGLILAPSGRPAEDTEESVRVEPLDNLSGTEASDG